MAKRQLFYQIRNPLTFGKLRIETSESQLVVFSQGRVADFGHPDDWGARLASLFICYILAARKQ
ncbi:MAG: hypothetical protein LAO78_18065 [Acidobacteriia bacterium]|nr:hypothetical protein [Terriglobia bacterium]